MDKYGFTFQCFIKFLKSHPREYKHLIDRNGKIPLAIEMKPVEKYALLPVVKNDDQEKKYRNAMNTHRNAMNTHL